MLAANLARICKDIETLGSFTAGEGDGVTRLTFSAEDAAARQYLRRVMEGIGLTVAEVPPGVLIGRLGAPDGVGPPIMAGSHIDSVRNGGTLDGVLGVVAALEVARVLVENRVALHAPFEVVAFPEEDGARFGTVLAGSKAWVGQLGVDQLRQMRDPAGISYIDAMEQAGFPAAELPYHLFRRGTAQAFLELHIEQSVILEAGGIDIGVVTGITGIRGFDVTLQGVANHAGATPMTLRNDALAGAAEIILGLEDRAARLGGHTVCTVGQIDCRPGARNAIPGEVRFSVDFRDIDEIDVRAEDMLSCVREIALRRRLGVEVVPIASSDPVTLSPSLQALIEAAAARRGLSCLRMSSGAVHDAQVLAPLVETAMIFVPSRGGRSHCPEEFTEPAQIENGANVLLDVVLALVN
jgi:allantoate deiminase